MIQQGIARGGVPSRGWPAEPTMREPAAACAGRGSRPRGPAGTATGRCRAARVVQRPARGRGREKTQRAPAAARQRAACTGSVTYVQSAGRSALACTKSEVPRRMQERQPREEARGARSTSRARVHPIARPRRRCIVSAPGGEHRGVVVPAHHHRAPPDVARDEVEHGARIGAVADEIAQEHVTPGARARARASRQA